MTQLRNEADRMLAAIHRVAGHPVLPPCVVLGCIGQGGMAVVYRGWHLNLGIDVAIKCMRPSLLANAGDFVERFRREGQSAARINHQNVIRVFDVAEHQGLHYLIMELVEGETARQRVARKGALPVGEALQLLLEAARGLGEAHQQGMVHRDIKPENLLVSRKGQVKVADLGLAKPALGQGLTLMSSPDIVMGTPQYMPPEQWDGPNVTPATDVWALGATLWYVLAGRDAIRGDEAYPRIMARICTQPFPDVRAVRPDVPPAVAALIATATAKEPGERFATAEAMAEAIEAMGLPRASLRDDFTRNEEAPTLVGRPSQGSLAAIKDWLRHGAITPDLPLDVAARPAPVFADDAAPGGEFAATVPRAAAPAAKGPATVARSATTKPSSTPPTQSPLPSPQRRRFGVLAVAAGLAAVGAAAALRWNAGDDRSPAASPAASPVASPVAPAAVADFTPVQGQGPVAPRERAGVWLVGDGRVRFRVVCSDAAATPEFTVDGAAIPATAEDGAYGLDLPQLATAPCTIAVAARRPGEPGAGPPRRLTLRRVAVAPAWRAPLPGGDGVLSFRARAATVEVALGDDVERAAVELAGATFPLLPIDGRAGVFRGAVTAPPATAGAVLRWRDALGRDGELATPARLAAPPPRVADVAIEADGRQTVVAPGAAIVFVQGPQASLRFVAQDAATVELAVGGSPAAPVSTPVDLAALLPDDVVVDLRLVARGDGGESPPVVVRVCRDASPPELTVSPERLELPADARGAVDVACRDAAGVRGVWWSRRGAPPAAAVAVAAAADGSRRLDVSAPTSLEPVVYDVRAEDNAGRSTSRSFTVALAAPASAPSSAPVLVEPAGPTRAAPVAAPPAPPPAGFRAAKDASVRDGLLTAIEHEATGIVLELRAGDGDGAFYFARALVTGAQFDAADAAETPRVSIGGDDLRGWFAGRGAGLRLPTLAQRRRIADRVVAQGKKEWLRPERWNATRWPVFEPQTAAEASLDRGGNSLVGFRVVVEAPPR